MYDGKKVFFVLPHEIVREHIVKVLSENEYEVYVLADQRKLTSIVSKFPESIVFVNIDVTQSEREWRVYIKRLIDDNPRLQVGIISGRITDRDMVNFYIMDVGINCGFIQLRQGIKDCSANMLKVLEANEAKGKRKFLRYRCGLNENTTLNFIALNKRIGGNILDISSVGFSCVIDQQLEFSKNELIKDVQLKLNGILILTDCVFIGCRDVPGELLYVFLFRFSPGRMIQRSKICSFIHFSLQKDLERIIA